ncbi:MAG: glycosyltransferase family 2 protein [Janthinobacterium lividum]
MDASQVERLPLSVVVATLDEAANIGDCLRSVVGLAAEIVVLDSGSQDDTCLLARRAGARVEVALDWRGFGIQKNRALALAREPWVLSLDADERVTPELAEAIRQAITSAAQSGYSGFELPRLSQFCGHWIHHSGWYPDLVLRLFLKSKARFSEDLVHERVILDGPRGRLHTPLLHYSYTSRAEVDEKVERYGRAGAAQLHARGKTCSAAAPWLRGGWAWLRTMLIKRGLLDGRAGWQIASMNARTTYLKYALLRRMRGQPQA